MLCLAVILNGRPVSPVNAATAQSAALGGCPMFPRNNIWNRPVNGLPVDAHSADYINSIGPGTGLHPDFGSGLWQGAPIGIPYDLVTSAQAKSAVIFTYGDESDAGPYPIPATPQIEGGPNSSGDRHILMVDTSSCILYELYAAYPPANGLGWTAGSGAIYNLRSNALRIETYTSADAAGLPILPGLARYDEVAAGHIDHALRFTVQTSQKAYVWPARHYASKNISTSLPPMGMRFRLKASFNTAGYPPQARVVLEALKTYGMIVADNGSNWYISGVPDSHWDNDDLSWLAKVKGDNFEAVNTSGLVVSSDSGAVPWYPGLPGSGCPWQPASRLYLKDKIQKSLDRHQPAVVKLTRSVNIHKGLCMMLFTSTQLKAFTTTVENGSGLAFYARSAPVAG